MRIGGLRGEGTGLELRRERTAGDRTVRAYLGGPVGEEPGGEGTTGGEAGAGAGL